MSLIKMYFEGDPHILLCLIDQTIADPKVIDGLKARLDMAHTVPVAFRAFRFDVVLRSRRSILFENKL
jgi:protocatechuate 3,4-dioxygenase beta subunit